MGHIPYELVTLLPIVSNHVISAFQQGFQAFPLVKIKTTKDNAYDHSYPFSVNPLAAEPLDYGENLSAFNTCGILLFLHSIFCFVKVLR
jgi:hypothetical protein